MTLVKRIVSNAKMIAASHLNKIVVDWKNLQNQTLHIPHFIRINV